MASELSPIPQLLIPLKSGTCLPISLIPSGEWTIGRGQDNAIVLKNKWVSRKHAVVQSVEMGSIYLVYFVDLGSLNGSRVNGQAVKAPVLLQHEDVINIGDIELKFYYHYA
uniref:FHA domain containing protein n=1 Tax=Cyanothece sp. (strain PCC 7425 / ATCC 29141) TaxID=395961 RepID=B8HRL6_CYAP4